MKKTLNSMMHRAYAMLLAVIMVFAGLEVFADSDVFAESEIPKSGMDYTQYDDRYTIIYEKFKELQRDPPLKPSEAYAQYGEMIGDYYMIVLEENLRYLNGDTDIVLRDLVMLLEGLQKTGTIPVKTRQALREDVTKYGMPEEWIPYDPDFIGDTAERQPVDGASLEYAEQTQEYKEQWEDRHGIEHTTDPVETTEPTPVVTEPPVTITATFADVASDAWYAEAVTHMVESGIVKGKDDGLFHPDDTITIAEWCALLYRIADKTPYEDASHFVEKPDGTRYTHWAAVPIYCVGKMGLTTMVLGAEVYPEGGAAWDAIAQRGEAMTAVSYILQKMYYSETNPYNTTSVVHEGPWTWEDIPDADVVQQGLPSRPRDNFFPTASTHYWDSLAVLNAYNFGFVNGTDSAGTCNPTGSMTRAQACQMLYKAGLDHNVGLYRSWGNGGVF